MFGNKNRGFDLHTIIPVYKLHPHVDHLMEWHGQEVKLKFLVIALERTVMLLQADLHPHMILTGKVKWVGKLWIQTLFHFWIWLYMPPVHYCVGFFFHVSLGVVILTVLYFWFFLRTRTTPSVGKNEEFEPTYQNHLCNLPFLELCH